MGTSKVTMPSCHLPVVGERCMNPVHTFFNLLPFPTIFRVAEERLKVEEVAVDGEDKEQKDSGNTRTCYRYVSKCFPCSNAVGMAGTKCSVFSQTQSGSWGTGQKIPPSDPL